MSGSAQWAWTAPLLGLLVLFSSPRADAAPTDRAAGEEALAQPPEIAAAQRLMERGDFEQAVRTLRQGLRAHDLTSDQTAELYRLLGFAYLSLGEEEKAQGAYEQLLALDPNFELPSTTPPKLRAIYDRVRAEIRARQSLPASVELSPLPNAPGDFPVEVRARVANLPAGGKARFLFRRDGASAFSALGLLPKPGDEGTLQVNLPGYEIPAEPKSYPVDYYAELLNAQGKWVAGDGDQFEPHQFLVTGGTDRRGLAWYQRPWVWGLSAAVVAGAVVGGVMIAASNRSGSLSFQLQVKGT